MGVSCQRHALAVLTQDRPSTHYIGGWQEPRTGLDECGKPRLNRDSMPGLSKL